MKEIFNEVDFNWFDEEISLNLDILNKKSNKVMKLPYYIKCDKTEKILISHLIEQFLDDGIREIFFSSKDFSEDNLGEEDGLYECNPIFIGQIKYNIEDYKYLIKITNPKSGEILYTEF